MKKLSSYNNSQAESSDLPFGNLRNESGAGNNDGTEIVAEHMQDIYYSLYQVLQLAGVSPNGVLENGNNAKQFLSALSNVAPLLYSSTSTYNKHSTCLRIENNIIYVYKSLIANNTQALTNTSAWVLLYQISDAGILGNMKLNSPALSGTPTAPTAAAGTATTQIATTAFVKKTLRSFIKVTSGKNTNGATISPPSGFTMADLVAFIPAVSDIYYSGDVNGDDHTHCNYTIGANNITLNVYSSEQRAATYANWIAIWIKA